MVVPVSIALYVLPSQADMYCSLAAPDPEHW